MGLVLASLLLPGHGVEFWVKAVIIAVSFAFPFVWTTATYDYYEKGGSLISEVAMPVMEALGFAVLLTVFVVAFRD